jgi:hypothetical protein
LTAKLDLGVNGVPVPHLAEEGKVREVGVKGEIRSTMGRSVQPWRLPRAVTLSPATALLGWLGMAGVASKTLMGMDLQTLKGSTNALFPFPTIAQHCQTPARRTLMGTVLGMLATTTQMVTESPLKLTTAQLFPMPRFPPPTSNLMLTVMVWAMPVTIVLVYQTPNRRTPMVTMLEMPAARTRMGTLCLTRMTTVREWEILDSGMLTGTEWETLVTTAD